MAAVSVLYPTLGTLAKNVDPGWKEAQPIIELLSLTHGLGRVAPFMEANLATGERATVRTGLATPAWRMFNIGTPVSTTSEATVEFQCGILKSINEIDTELLKIAPNREAFVLSRGAGHTEGMMQEWSSTAFYGTAASPEEFVGIAAMFNLSTASNGRNVLKAGGADASDNTSIYMMELGADVHAIYPRGSTAGISRSAGNPVVWAENFGGTGNRALVYREEYSMGAGFVVRDWRKVVRICNIDYSALVAQTNDADLVYWGVKAKHRLNSARGGGRRVALMNSTTAEYLEHQYNDRLVVGGGITVSNIDGQDIMKYCGAEVVIDDNILNTESLVA